MLAIPLRRTPRPFAGIEPIIWGSVAAAWALALGLAASGRDAHLGHDTVLGGAGLPAPRDLLVFLVAWQAMTAGMMLPSTLPLVRLFARASRGQARPRLALGAFLAAYFVVWTGFAGAALAADAGVHGLTGRWGWLQARPEVIGGGVLLLAGVFQFSPLKERCLDACRNPMHFMWRFYGRGAGRAWRFGLHHGLFCLGCCWALMLVMFAVGVGSLAVMALLTGVMTLEKTARRGRRLAPVAGVVLLLGGGVVLVQPGWLPDSLGATPPSDSSPASPAGQEHHHR